MEFLERIRSKPEYIKRRILYVTVPTLTAIIISLWLFSPIQKIAEVQEAEKVKEVAPTNIVKQDFYGVWSDVWQRIKNTNSELNISGTINNIKANLNTK